MLINQYHANETLMVFFAGDITQKGHDKKRAKILAPFLKTNNQGKFLYN